jgi:hypothetical protein
MPRESFEFSLGPHTVRIKQLAPDDALRVCDALINRVSEPVVKLLVNALPSLLDGKGDAGAFVDQLLAANVSLTWPADADGAGFTRMRNLFTASAELKNEANGAVVWLPLKDCTESVFGGHPGRRYKFDSQCVRANVASFLADMLEGGWGLRPATG